MRESVSGFSFTRVLVTSTTSEFSPSRRFSLISNWYGAEIRTPTDSPFRKISAVSNTFPRSITTRFSSIVQFNFASYLIVPEKVCKLSRRLICNNDSNCPQGVIEGYCKEVAVERYQGPSKVFAT